MKIEIYIFSYKFSLSVCSHTAAVWAIHSTAQHHTGSPNFFNLIINYYVHSFGCSNEPRIKRSTLRLALI